MTRPAASALIGLALLVLAPLAAPFASAAPTTFTIDVVSARSLGCSPDSFTQPDLRVRVLVNGAVLATTPEASDQSEPTFAMAVTASAALPAQVGIEVEEGEPAGFLGSSTTYVPCSVAAGGATRATFTFAGAAAQALTTRGDDAKAAEVTLVVGTGAPTAPRPRNPQITTDSVTYQWDGETSDSGPVTYRFALGGAGRLLPGSTSYTAATVPGLCDNTDYTFRLLRDTPTWHVSSDDVTVRTANAPPQMPTVLSATRDGNVSFQSATTHDIARYEIHAVASTDVGDTSATLRKSVAAGAGSFARFDVQGVAFRSDDHFIRVLAVDTGGLSQDSWAFEINGTPQAASLMLADDCTPRSAIQDAPGYATATPGPGPVVTTPSAPTPTTPLQLEAVAAPGGYSSYAEINASFETKFVPALSFEGGDVVNVTAGGTLELDVMLVNKGPYPIHVEGNYSMVVHNDTDIGLAPARGYSVAMTPANVTLDPYSKQTVKLTLRVPADAMLGDRIAASQGMRLRSGSYDAGNAWGVVFAARVVPVAAALPPAGGVLSTGGAIALVAAGVGGAGLAIALWLRRDAAKYAVATMLYTRLAKSDVLDNPKRDELHQRIVAAPGIRYSDLKRQSGLETGALVHHLRSLERAGIVTSRKVGSARRFYAQGAAPAPTPETLRVQALTPMQTRVLEILKEAPLTQGELAARLGLTQQAISYHVKGLERAGHLEAVHDGNAWRYRAITKFEVVR